MKLRQKCLNCKTKEAKRNSYFCSQYCKYKYKSSQTNFQTCDYNDM